MPHKIDDCVSKLTKKGYSVSKAYAICKSTIIDEPKTKKKKTKKKKK